MQQYRYQLVHFQQLRFRKLNLTWIVKSNIPTICKKIFAVFDDESATNNSSEQQSKCLAGDITEEESLQALQLLLENFEGIFNLNDTSPAHLPPIHVDMKEEY